MLSFQPAGNNPKVTSVVAVVLVIWLALVFFLGARGSFIRPLGEPPLPVLIGFTAPIAAFLAAYWILSSFRHFVLTVDLRLATSIQAWRFAGLGFIALYTHGVLPGLFAWPAGLGDIAISVTAPWMVLALIRRPGFAAGKLFVVWNLLGIGDLIVAVSTGAISSRLALSAAGEATIFPMSQLPLVLVPAYLVPLFIVLHLTALFQARRIAVSVHKDEA